MTDGSYIDKDDITRMNRRESWDKCGHHGQLEKELEKMQVKLDTIKTEMRSEMSNLKKDIGDLKGNDRAYEERFTTLFAKLDELTLWIKGLVMLGMGALATLFIWMVQGGGGL